MSLSRQSLSQLPEFAIAHDHIPPHAICSLFAKKVLQFAKPGALIFGGDLVDAKTLHMQGHQYKQEWEVSALTLHAMRHSLQAKRTCARLGAFASRHTLCFVLSLTTITRQMFLPTWLGTC